MRIIQISGKGRVGKTTLANFIAKRAFDKGYIPVLLPFAASLKKAAEDAGFDKKTHPDEYRKYCQEFGAIKRAEDEDYWVNQTYEKIQEYMVLELDKKTHNNKYWEYLIIQDDVRFMNELALGRDLVATQIFVDSGGRILEEPKASWRNHESEILANAIEASFNFTHSEYEELFDVVISNGSTLKYLDKEVKDYLDEWLDMGFLELEDIDEPTEGSNS